MKWLVKKKKVVELNWNVLKTNGQKYVFILHFKFKTDVSSGVLVKW